MESGSGNVHKKEIALLVVCRERSVDVASAVCGVASTVHKRQPVTTERLSQ